MLSRSSSGAPLEMMQDFNLLLAAPRDREDQACSEAWHFLKEAGDDGGEAEFTGITGLVTGKTSLDPFRVIARWREFALEKPWDFRVLLKATPIELVVPSETEKIVEAAEKLSAKIAEKETFRITVHNRASSLHSAELIPQVGSRIPRTVDLEGFQKMLNIEILGDLTGLSVLAPDDILSISKIRDRWFEERYEVTS